MKKPAIYIRVSTKEQNLENQIAEFREYFAKHEPDLSVDDCLIYQDKISGKHASRQGLNRLQLDASRGRISKVYFWALDRLSRAGVQHVLRFVLRLEDLGIEPFFLKDPLLNEVDPMFRYVMYTILAEQAKKERERISERIKAGLKRRKAEGKRVGAIPIQDDVKDLVVDLFEKGTPKAQIAREADISRPKVYDILRERECID